MPPKQLYKPGTRYSIIHFLLLKTMKQILFSACAAFLLVGCQPAATTTESKDSSSTAEASTAAVTYDYPYTIDHPDNWTPGDQQHVVTVLKGLKAFENGDIPAAMASFGDSVKFPCRP